VSSVWRRFRLLRIASRNILGCLITIKENSRRASRACRKCNSIFSSATDKLESTLIVRMADQQSRLRSDTAGRWESSPFVQKPHSDKTYQDVALTVLDDDSSIRLPFAQHLGFLRESYDLWRKTRCDKKKERNDEGKTQSLI
jgi:hypothetical protein